MSYIIHITATSERDIMRAGDYIEFTLKNPTAAEHLLDAATEQINSLADLPEKFRLADDPVLGSWGIRFVIVFFVRDFPLFKESHHTGSFFNASLPNSVF